MKNNSLFIIGTLLLSISCISKDNIKSDKDIITEYLNKNENTSNVIEFEEISEPDSLYSPYNKLLSLSYISASISLDMTKYSSRAWEVKSKKEAFALLDSATYLFNKDSHSLDSVLFQSAMAIDFPKYEPGEINRKAVIAKYKINGESHENIFFFNRDTNTIGHTSDENKLLLIKAKKGISAMNDTYREVLRDRSDIRNL
ncbi:hypothetical protein [Parabacteroides sp. AM08-6]|uniref:hypothetical protein n=1 Tax=Parabacteroides sp. AM08-6 TaxID=2292053 RepID=UPI0011C3CB6A|nr:hypothetical protein [Parabacteroides sp. AM08-6]